MPSRRVGHMKKSKAPLTFDFAGLVGDDHHDDVNEIQEENISESVTLNRKK
jgi:hypothetical protein